MNKHSKTRQRWYILFSAVLAIGATVQMALTTHNWVIALLSGLVVLAAMIALDSLKG